jgi:hypothetical protein
MSDEQITHDRLQYEAFTWAHNTIPVIRGRLFAVLNEIKPVSWVDRGNLIREPKTNHLKRISQAKAIGLQSGALDLLFMAPDYEGPANDPNLPDATEWVSACNYGFDAKIGSDKIHDKQLDFVQILQNDGGNGYPFYSLQEFQSIFIPIIRKHYGPII